MQGQDTRNPLNAAFWSGAWMLGLAFVFSFFTTMLLLTTPLFLLLIYDRVLSARSQETLVALFGLVVLLLCLLALFDYARRRILARFGARLQGQLELRVLDVVQARAPRSALGSGPVSGTKELDRLRGFFHSGALIAVLDFLWAPIFLGAVFLFHPLLGWVAVIGVLVLLGVCGLRAIFSAHLADDADAATARVNDVARRIRDAQPTIASQGMAGPIVKRWRQARGNARDMSILLADRVTWFKTGSTHLRLFFQALILALGANLHLQNKLTVGGMVACFILIGRVFLPVDNLLKNLPAITSARTNWRMLAGTLREAPAAEEALPAPAAAIGGLSVRDLRPDCGPAAAACLDGVSFSVAQGEVVQISGALGSGKTVLAAALAGQLPLLSGSVTIGGRNFEQFGTEALSRIVGYLPEDIGFFPGTIAQNISRMNADTLDKEIVAAAGRAGAHAIISKLPKGYGTKLDPFGSGLSRGERQRIALARAVYRRPTILIVDDTAEIMPVKCGIFSEGGPAVVLLSRAPRSLVVPSRHFRLQGGALTRQEDIPALIAKPQSVVAAPRKIARG